jgi:hypothetical protein
MARWHREGMDRRFGRVDVDAAGEGEIWIWEGEGNAHSGRFAPNFVGRFIGKNERPR